MNIKIAAAALVVLLSALYIKKDLITKVLSSKNGVKTTQNFEIAKGSLYDFKVNTLEGKPLDLSEYKGKKVVILNVASKCGFTPQYADWQKFHEAYGSKIAVLGFPANDFLKQEPGSNDEIAEFCQKNYGVSFQMFEKVEVTGKSKHPLFKWLSQKELNGWNDQEPTWNFCKYIINENGQVTHFFESKILPSNQDFKKAIGI